MGGRNALPRIVFLSSGEFFIEYRFDRDVGGGKRARWTGSARVRRVTNEYVAFFVDNLGNARTYEVTIDGSTWMFIGKFERATQPRGLLSRTVQNQQLMFQKKRFGNDRAGTARGDGSDRCYDQMSDQEEQIPHTGNDD
jgi:hypothetical protein